LILLIAVKIKSAGTRTFENTPKMNSTVPCMMNAFSKYHEINLVTQLRPKESLETQAVLPCLRRKHCRHCKALNVVVPFILKIVKIKGTNINYIATLIDNLDTDKL